MVPLTCNFSVELRGFEPLTPSMPWRCATSCATAPRGPGTDEPSPRGQTLRTAPVPWRDLTLPRRRGVRRLRRPHQRLHPLAPVVTVLDALLGRGVRFPTEVLVEDLAEDRLAGGGAHEQRDAGAQLLRVEVAEDLLRGAAW